MSMSNTEMQDFWKLQSRVVTLEDEIRDLRFVLCQLKFIELSEVKRFDGERRISIHIPKETLDKLNKRTTKR